MEEFNSRKEHWFRVSQKVIVLLGLVLNAANGCDIGTANPGSHTASTGASTDGRSFFIDGAASTCCGTMANWKMYASSAGTVTAMLWRPTTGNNYRLEFMEDYNVNVGLNTPIPSTTVAVEVGDVVGWKTAGAEIIPNSATAGSSTQTQLLSPTLNAETPWGQTPNTTVTYAFGAVVVPNDPPTITGGSETISDTDTSQTVHTLAIADTDTANLLTDTTVVISNTNPTTSDFSIADDGTNFIIQSGASLTAGTYELEITAKDICEESASATVTITVQNPPPVLSNLGGSTGPIGDLTAVGTSIFQFTVTDQDDPNNCTVSDGDFSITELNPGTAGTQLYNIVTAATLDQDTTPSYTLTISCNDGTNAAVTNTLTVTVSDEAPTLSGLDITTSATVSDGVQAADVTLASLTVTDANDVIKSQVTCAIQAPNTALFQLTGTPPNMDVTTVTGQTLETASAPYEVVIHCDDDEAANTVSGTVTVPLTDTPPEFVDMPATLSPAISDSTAADTLLHSFSVTDTASATITCSFTAPAPYDNDFNIQGTPPDFEIWVLAANDLNFDVDATVPVTVTCIDDTTPITENFTVAVFDEDPVWTGLPTATPYSTLSDAEPAAVSLYTFSVADSDDSINCAISSADSTHFEVRAGTPPVFEIWYKGAPPASLNYDTAPSHDLPILCDDGAAYSQTEIYTVNLENTPPTFVNLPDASPTISESVTTKTSLYTVSVSDTTEVVCYLADTVTAAGIEPVEKGNVALPITEYVVYAYHTTGFDVDTPPGTVTIDITCGDSVSTITDTLTVTILNAAPEITNPGGTYNVPEDEDGQLTLKTLNFVEFDAADVTCTMTNNDGGPFNVSGNQVIKTAGNLDFENNPSYTLEVTCTDGTLSTTDTITVNVENVGPEITNLPTTAEIPEEQVAEVSLIEFTLSEDAVACSQVAPVESEFVVKYVPASAAWSVFYVSQAVAGKELNYAAKPFYDLTVVCEDASGSRGAERTFTINVLDNEAPNFDNIGGQTTTKHEILAKDYSAGDTVFTVQATDPSSPADPITYNLISCEPAATCNFTLTPNGDIVTDVDLHSHPLDTYKFTIQAVDEYNPNAPPAELILKINEINTPPVFTNLPKKDKVSVLENQHAAGDTVFTMSADDVDAPATDTLTYHCDFPDGGDTYFELVPDTGEIITKDVIDYEEMSILGQIEYRVECYVNDGYVDSDVETFTLRINDENEQPEFNTLTWTLTQPNEGGHGTEVGCPDFDGDIQDEDIFDDHKYKMDCGNGDGVFVMDKHTGCITMLKEWDLDVASKRLARESITCTVTATDKGGLETTSTVVITVEESDDNKPYHDQTSYHFCATEGTTSGTLGSVTASDDDVLAEHRQLSYSFIGGGPFSDDGNGGLTYGDVSSYAKGTTFQTTLRVTDEAGNFDDAPVTVMICDPPTSSAAAAASSSSSSSSSSTSNLLLWLIPTILLALLALGLLAYCLRRFCCRGGCGKCRPCLKSSAARTKVVRPVQQMRLVQRPVLVQRQVMKQVATPMKVVQRPVTRVQTVQKLVTPSQQPAQMINGDLLMHNYWAREKANLGQDMPLTG